MKEGWTGRVVSARLWGQAQEHKMGQERGEMVVMKFPFLLHPSPKHEEQHMDIGTMGNCGQRMLRVVMTNRMKNCQEIKPLHRVA